MNAGTLPHRRTVVRANFVWLLVVLSLTPATLRGQGPMRKPPAGPYERILNINRLYVSLSRVGNLTPRTGDEGGCGTAWYNGYEGPLDPSNFVYDAGLWVTAKIDGRVTVLPVAWGSSYGPGPIVNGQPAMAVRPEDSVRYRQYRITYGDTPEDNIDFATWPADLGAPVDDHGSPVIAGDQTIWSVYNGRDTSRILYWFRRDLGSMPPLPVEIHQKVFGHFGTYADTSVWANTAFFEWSIYNRGSVALDSVWFSLWVDADFPYPDLAYAIPAVDTSCQLGYSWYAPDPEKFSGGFVLLHGPTVPSPDSTATAFGRPLVHHRNLPLTGFQGIVDDSSPNGYLLSVPQSSSTAWNVARGRTPAGTLFIDPFSGLPTPFLWSGDPLTRQGTLFPQRAVGGGGGFMMMTGPVTMAPGDSQWVLMALVPSKKTNGVDAITRLRRDATFLLHQPYDSLITRKPRRKAPSPPPPLVLSTPAYAFFPAYPNPFNAGTTLRFSLPAQSQVRIEVFDILGQKIEEVVNAVFERGYRQVPWNPSLASGVYIARIQATSLEKPGRVSTLSQRLLLMR